MESFAIVLAIVLLGGTAEAFYQCEHFAPGSQDCEACCLHFGYTLDTNPLLQSCGCRLVENNDPGNDQGSLHLRHSLDGRGSSGAFSDVVDGPEGWDTSVTSNPNYPPYNVAGQGAGPSRNPNQRASGSRTRANNQTVTQGRGRRDEEADTQSNNALWFDNDYGGGESEESHNYGQEDVVDSGNSGYSGYSGYSGHSDHRGHPGNRRNRGNRGY